MNSIYFLTNSSNTLFLKTSLSTTSLTLLKSIGTAFNLSTSNSSAIDFKLAKSVF